MTANDIPAGGVEVWSGPWKVGRLYHTTDTAIPAYARASLLRHGYPFVVRGGAAFQGLKATHLDAYHTAPVHAPASRRALDRLSVALHAERMP